MYLRLTWKCEVGAHLGLKRLARAVGGGGGCSAYYGINRAEGGIKGGNGRRYGGGAGWDKHLGGILGGGYDGTNTLAASPGGGGGGGGKHPGGIPPGGGGWDQHPGATPVPQPDEECESCRGKGGEG